jgi:hypothetical protein
METKWASLVSYGLTVEALTDFLPLEVTLDVKTIRHDVLKVAERCEAELGEEQWSFIEGCPRDWGALPIPDGPITVGIDGGYVRDWEAKKHNFGDCSRATGFIPLGPDEVMQGFVDGLRLELHATYLVADAKFATAEIFGT